MRWASTTMGLTNGTEPSQPRPGQITARQPSRPIPAMHGRNIGQKDPRASAPPPDGRASPIGMNARDRSRHAAPPPKPAKPTTTPHAKVRYLQQSAPKRQPMWQILPTLVVCQSTLRPLGEGRWLSVD